MRITIIPSENLISINGNPIRGCDLSWIPEFVGDVTGVPQKVHAVQWYDDHGEIELVTRDNNIIITELGIFEQSIIKYEERKMELEAEPEPEAESEYMDIDHLLEELLTDEDLQLES